LKVAVIFHRFGPYHCARLEGASRRCAVVGIELGSETGEYEWAKVEQSNSFEWVTLFPQSDSRSRPVEELEKAMTAALFACQPDAVAIPGWSDKGALAALRWCLENEVPAVLMSESAAIDEPRSWWKEFVKRRIVALYSAALVGGQRHKEYLVTLGMASDQIFMGYDAVDNGYFAQGAKEVESRKEKVESELRGNYFLASARFIPKKNLDALIRAYAEYRQRAEGRGQNSDLRPLTSDLRPATSDLWSLVILGDGPLKSDLRSLISDLGLDDFVVMPGFKQYDELPAYYALAKAFVHPSTSEQWGLVVNEAMASGLPVLVSERCGCSPELVQDGNNGFTFDPDDQSQLTSQLLAMASLPAEERERMGEAGREIIKEFGPESFGEGLERAARFAGSQPRKHLGAMDRLILNRMLSR
jgi:glycosyltransferase involved in cell wall biosynthesis